MGFLAHPLYLHIFPFHTPMKNQLFMAGVRYPRQNVAPAVGLAGTCEFCAFPGLHLPITKADFLAITKQPSLVHIEEVVTEDVLGHCQTEVGAQTPRGSPYGRLFYQRIPVPVPPGPANGSSATRN